MFILTLIFWIIILWIVLTVTLQLLAWSIYKTRNNISQNKRETNNKDIIIEARKEYKNIEKAQFEELN